jgi:hypothetical protein
MERVVYIPLLLAIHLPLSFTTGRGVCIDSLVVRARFIVCTTMLMLFHGSKYNQLLTSMLMIATGSESLDELVSSVRQRLSIVDGKDSIQLLVKLTNLA